MSVTININVPDSSVAEARVLPGVVKNASTPVDVDPLSGGNPLIPLQGAPVSMLLFALTRATTTDHNNLMTQDQLSRLNTNSSFYNIFKGSGAGAVFVGNGIQVFQAFFSQHPEFVATLQQAQAMYPVFKKFITDQGIWDDTCELKYTQLANFANIDWQGID
jgi:hypothetical protein